jgi:DNA polymerase II small subunit/DNA polymerase delta subunit B
MGVLVRDGLMPVEPNQAETAARFAGHLRRVTSHPQVITRPSDQDTPSRSLVQAMCIALRAVAVEV